MSVVPLHHDLDEEYELPQRVRGVDGSQTQRFAPMPIRRAHASRGRPGPPPVAVGRPDIVSSSFRR